MPAATGGLAAAAALVTTVTAMDNQGLGGSGALLRSVVDLGELKARAGIGKGRQGPDGAVMNSARELVGV
jgi:hypothetical protein